MDQEMVMEMDKLPLEGKDKEIMQLVMVMLMVMLTLVQEMDQETEMEEDKLMLDTPTKTTYKPMLNKIPNL